jgi:hypothetical protein
MYRCVVDGGVSLMIEGDRTEGQVNAELRKLDPHLFLDPEFSPEGEFGGCTFWTVKYSHGDREPTRILSWRERLEGGKVRPIPLCDAIIAAVRRREGQFLDPNFMRKIDAENNARAEKAWASAEDKSLEIGLDVGPRLKATRSAVLHRGVHLRRSRDRERAAGAKV